MKAAKQKFILYTNPNNVTNKAYEAIGTQEVNDVKKGVKKYPDSYFILFEGRGTEADILEIKKYYSNYRF